MSFLVLLTSVVGAFATRPVVQHGPQVNGASAATQAEVREERAASIPIITYEDGLLSVTLQRLRLESVLNGVSRQTQVVFVLDPALQNQVVSVQFENLSLDDGMRQLLKNQDVFYFYGVKGDASYEKPEKMTEDSADEASELPVGEQPSSLIAVWVYPRGRGHGFQAMPLERWAARMSTNREALPRAEQAPGSPAGSAVEIHVKFRPGSQTDPPELLLPSELRNSVASMARLFTLPERELDGLGAGRLNWWFKIALTPGTDANDFIQRLDHLKNVEVVERAPVPAPPP